MLVSLSVGSVCSGIGAPECAWGPLGWRFAWSSDIEPFPNAVRAHHWPHVPNLGDMTTIAARVLAGEVEAPDVLVGGTPCQSFSVAGLRKGLADERGNLALEFIRLADAIDTVRCAAGQPHAWILWENVPGVLSDAGNAFGAFLAGLVGSDAPIAPRGRWTDAGVVDGPARCAAWRILDAQYDGLAQRRERVFVLARGGAGAWAAADALLPIVQSVRWHPAPRREAREGVAGSLTTRPDRGGANREGSDGALVAWGGNNTAGPIDVAAALNACATAAGRQDFESETFITDVAPTLNANGKAAGSATQQDAEGGMLIAHTLRAEGFDASEDGTGRGTPLVTHAIQAGALRENPNSGPDGVGVQADLAYTLEARAEVQAVAHTLRAEGFDASEDGTGRGTPLVPVAAPLTAGGHPNSNAPGRRKEDDTLQAKNPKALAHGMAVRRLTPTECERLQGFPDGWTAVTYRGKPAADGPRYRALGNSMAVPVVAAIGRQIETVR